MVTMTKRSPRPRAGARRTSLLDLSGARLYAIISYRLAMAVIILIAVLYGGK